MLNNLTTKDIPVFAPLRGGHGGAGHGHDAFQHYSWSSGGYPDHGTAALITVLAVALLGYLLYRWARRTDV